MTRRVLTKRVQGVQQRVNPLPPPSFLAFAHAVIEFGGEEPTSDSAIRLAKWLASGCRLTPA